MNSKYLILGTAAVLVAVALAACAPAVATTAAPQSGNVGQPVAAVELAPTCQGGGACQAPTAQMFQLDCIQKVPYTNVLVEPGTTFEVLDKSGNFECKQTEYVSGGKNVVSCHGTPLYSFDLKLTNSACGGANLATGTGQCQEGYGFDAAQQCCAPVGGDAPGSVVVRVDLRDCPVPFIEEPPTPEP